MSAHSLSANERLKSTKTIQQLFAEGQSFSVFPIRIIYLWIDATHLRTNSPLQVAFSVGKKKFPNAVDRNLIKRRMREAYRLQKSILHQAIPESSEKQLALIFLFVGKEALPYQRVSGAMKKALSKLANKIV